MSEYDMKIHKSRSAKEWAKFFIKTRSTIGFEIDEGIMIGWFANAMMSMHESIFDNEIKTLKSQLKEKDALLKEAIDVMKEVSNRLDTQEDWRAIYPIEIFLAKDEVKKIMDKHD